MTTHRRIRTSLYEYLKDELRPDERTRVEQHLRSCPACTAHLHGLKETLQTLAAPGSRPSDERSPEFWNSFAERVMQTLGTEHRASKGVLMRTLEEIEELLFLRHRAVAVSVGALAIFLVTFTLWQWFSPRETSRCWSVSRT